MKAVVDISTSITTRDVGNRLLIRERDREIVHSMIIDEICQAIYWVCELDRRLSNKWASGPKWIDQKRSRIGDIDYQHFYWFF